MDNEQQYMKWVMEISSQEKVSIGKFLGGMVERVYTIPGED